MAFIFICQDTLNKCLFCKEFALQTSILRLCPQMESTAWFFKYKLYKFLKRLSFLAKTVVDFWKCQNNFSLIYSGLKYRFCKNFNSIGPLAFVLALVSHNNDNMHTDSATGIFLVRTFLFKPQYGFFTVFRLRKSGLEVISTVAELNLSINKSI